MKKMKTKISIAMGTLAVCCASPAVLKAATEAGEETRSRGEVIQTALLNTVMSIAIVFLALLLISRIIALFIYINRFETKLKAKNAPQAAAPSPEPEPEPEEEELSDDLELVAVITAAIAAYEEENGVMVPADELVVRSIRKVNKAKWQSA